MGNRSSTVISKRLGIGDVNFNLVPFLERQRFDHGGGKPTARLFPHLAICMRLSH